MKILIVDDTPANLLTLQYTLEDLSVEFMQASSGHEALMNLNRFISNIKRLYFDVRENILLFLR
jgi:CheY-like chemotaxis protein